MSTIAAVAATVLLAALAAFQLALVAGAPLGHLAWGGQSRVLPAPLRIGSLVSIAIYAAIAAVLLDRARLVDVVPDQVAAIAAWVIAAYFGLGIVMNLISRSVPERAVMTPVAAALCAFSVIVAIG